MLVSFNSNTNDDNSGSGTAFPSGAPGVCPFVFVLVEFLVVFISATNFA